jgi:ribonuclease J
MADPVRVVFLGGLGEIGRNCMAIEQQGRVLLIDCGLMFPDPDMHGIDLVLPDFTWLRENAGRIEASGWLETASKRLDCWARPT